LPSAPAREAEDGRDTGCVSTSAGSGSRPYTCRRRLRRSTRASRSAAGAGSTARPRAQRRARAAGRPTDERAGSSAAWRTLSEERDPELPECEDGHPEEQPAVAPAADVRLSVDARLVADGHVDDLQPKPRRSEEQVEVAERIEVAEVRAGRRAAFAVPSVQHLRAAARVLHMLPGHR